MTCRRSSPFLFGAALFLFASAGLDAGLRSDLSAEGARRAAGLTLYYRGLANEAASEWLPALEIFEELLAIDPANTAVAARAAELARGLGEPDRGLALVEASLAANPEVADAHQNLAQVLQRLSRGAGEEGPALQRRAREIAAAAARRFPGDIGISALQVDIYLGSGQVNAARQVLARALDEEQGDARYWLAMAELVAKVWLTDGADAAEAQRRVGEVYAKALAVADGNFATGARVVDYHISVGEYAEAIAVLEPLVVAHPGQLSAREKLARAYGIVGRPDEGLAMLRELVGADPNNARTQRLLAEMLAVAGEHEESVEHRARAMQLGGGGIDNYIELAVQLSDQFDPPQVAQALSWLRRGNALFPESPQLRYLEAVVLGKGDRCEEALRMFGEAEELAGKSLPALLGENFYFGYGSAAERAGEFDLAVGYFRRAVELVPPNAPELAAKSLNYHGYMLLERDLRLDEAGVMVRRAVELDPDNPVYLDSLGWYYFKKMLYRKALVELRRANELLGDAPDAEVLEHLAQVYRALGEEEKAASYRVRARRLGAPAD